MAVTLETVNLGGRVAPYGVGFHPWLSPGEGALDESTLRVDARAWVRTDERLLPIGREPIPAAIGFREPRSLGDTRLDDAFVEATHANGRSWVRLTGTDGKTAAAWMGESLTCWQLYSGDGIPTAARVRAGLAAEPMTCVADAFNTGDELIHLAPGQRHTVRWGIVLLED
jgi:aldose 1-epimerase